MREGCIALAKELVELLVIIFKPVEAKSGKCQGNSKLRWFPSLLCERAERTSLIQQDAVCNDNDSQIHLELSRQQKELSQNIKIMNHINLVQDKDHSSSQGFQEAPKSPYCSISFRDPRGYTFSHILCRRTMCFGSAPASPLGCSCVVDCCGSVT